MGHSIVHRPRILSGTDREGRQRCKTKADHGRIRVPWDGRSELHSHRIGAASHTVGSEQMKTVLVGHQVQNSHGPQTIVGYHESETSRRHEQCTDPKIDVQTAGVRLYGTCT